MDYIEGRVTPGILMGEEEVLRFANGCIAAMEPRRRVRYLTCPIDAGRALPSIMEILADEHGLVATVGERGTAIIRCRE
jgi:hypothetical protein